ncbi:hypothetical protein [Curtobacterium sp. MCLR17_034]|uniref:hypothetical protein n=1 Tax=Curtobacterium sp. MCLR17_034 TaxID=2175623 RepID=UPI000DA6FB04|nr:hypothetical protein [Curtobacterium sp. MCLR17_034]PZF11282.1 hypothetical protein DEI98_07775 [Curtobacterium sp. MCLR17_034]
MKYFQMSQAVMSVLIVPTAALIAGHAVRWKVANDFLTPSESFFHSAGTFFNALIAVRMSDIQLRSVSPTRSDDPAGAAVLERGRAQAGAPVAAALRVVVGPWVGALLDAETGVDAGATAAVAGTDVPRTAAAVTQATTPVDAAQLRRLR